jgi:type IV conjugative transfer system coupling protein TraD
MLILQDTPVGDLTRGGQIVIHFLRMLAQVLRKFSGALILATACGSVFTFLLLTQPYERYLGWRFVTSYLSTDVLKNGDQITQFERADGTSIDVRMRVLRASPALRAGAEQLLHRAEQSLWLAFIAILILFTLLVAWVWKSGNRQRRDQFLRGKEIIEDKQLAQYLKDRHRASDLHIGEVPLAAGTETLHILLTGSTGTGKTISLHELMGQARRRGERVICYSPSGDFIERFYRPGRDTVLNPFDERCPSWNLWDECPEPYHYDMLAAALIPEKTSSGDPFWNDAARSVISCLAQETARRNDRNIPRFLSLLQGDLPTLHNYLQHTEAGAQISPESEKPALSIRTTAVTYARSLKYLPIDRPTFHIREWVQNEDTDGCIFLTARDEQREAIRPLMSAWLELFTNSILSLAPDRDRRIWLFIDEMPSLNRIISLPNVLAQGRKYGCCSVLSFQQVSQLRQVYGKDAAESLVGGCATWVCMRQNDPETAEWIAKSFGQVEIMEAQQGLSYGANDMRDGVSLTQMRKLRPLLIPAEVSNLDDLEGYIRLPGRLPVAHLQLQWKRPRLVAPAFIRSTAPRAWTGITTTEAAAAAPTVSGDLFLADAHHEADAIRLPSDEPTAS